MKQLIVLTAALSLGLTACSKGGETAGSGDKAPASKAATSKAAPASKAAAPASKAPESKAAAPASAAPAAAADMAAAKTIYTQRCATCHGAEGKGDGPAGAALNPKPRTFNNAEWQGKVTDDHIAKIIVGGGPSVGMSPLMPPNPDLKAKPAVVAGLVKLVRGFGGK